MYVKSFIYIGSKLHVLPDCSLLVDELMMNFTLFIALCYTKKYYVEFLHFLFLLLEKKHDFNLGFKYRI